MLRFWFSILGIFSLGHIIMLLKNRKNFMRKDFILYVVFDVVVLFGSVLGISLT